MTGSHPDSWALLDVEVLTTQVEVVSDLLWSLGVAAIEEITPEPTVDESRTILRTSVGEDPSRVLAVLTVTFPDARILETFIKRDVADTWRQFVEPMSIDDRLTIVPAWLHESKHLVPSESRLFIEPGHTFGLGNHATTRATLRAARRWIPIGARVHDHGCGSGILALAMMKTHGCRCSVDDIAEGSRQVVEANAVLNKLERPMWCERGLDDLSDRCDAVLANILAPVLREHADKIEDSVRPGGLIILSGLRLEQIDSVCERYRRCVVEEIDDDDGWAAIVLRRRDDQET